VGRVVAKVEDPYLKELVDKLYGLRMLVEEIAFRSAGISKRLWFELEKRYNLDFSQKRYVINHYTYEITEDD